MARFFWAGPLPPAPRGRGVLRWDGWAGDPPVLTGSSWQPVKPHFLLNKFQTCIYICIGQPAGVLLPGVLRNHWVVHHETHRHNQRRSWEPGCGVSACGEPPFWGVGQGWHRPACTLAAHSLCPFPLSAPSPFPPQSPPGLFRPNQAFTEGVEVCEQKFCFSSSSSSEKMSVFPLGRQVFSTKPKGTPERAVSGFWPRW